MYPEWLLKCFGPFQSRKTDVFHFSKSNFKLFWSKTDSFFHFSWSQITQKMNIFDFLSFQSMPRHVPTTQAFNSDHFGPSNPQKQTQKAWKRSRFCPTLTFLVNFHVKFWSQTSFRPFFGFKVHGNKVRHFQALANALSKPSRHSESDFLTSEWSKTDSFLSDPHFFSQNFESFGPVFGFKVHENKIRHFPGTCQCTQKVIFWPQNGQKRTRFHFF